jgi:hypothetical protein
VKQPAYYRRVLRRAVSDTRRTAVAYGIWPTLLIGALGFLAYGLWQGWPTAVSRVPEMIASVLVPVAAITAVGLVVHLILAPPRLARDEEDQRRDVEQQLKDVRSAESEIRVQLRDLHRRGDLLRAELLRPVSDGERFAQARHYARRAKRWHSEVHLLVWKHFPERASAVRWLGWVYESAGDEFVKQFWEEMAEDISRTLAGLASIIKALGEAGGTDGSRRHGSVD